MAVLILSCLVIMCFSCAAIRILKLCSSVPTAISVSLKNMLLRVEHPGNGGLGVYQTLVDAFAMKDGSLPITGYDGNYGNRLSTRNPAIRNAVFLRKRISVKLSTTFTVIVRELQSTRLEQMVAPIIKWLPPALTICMSVVNLVSI